MKKTVLIITIITMAFAITSFNLSKKNDNEKDKGLSTMKADRFFRPPISKKSTMTSLKTTRYLIVY